MGKAVTLSDEELTELEARLNKGWVIRPDQVRALIAMARERNQLAASIRSSMPMRRPSSS
jgi:hypothetical protein